PPAQQEELLRTWLAEGSVRDDARSRITGTLVMRAIAERDGVALQPSQASEIVNDLAKATRAPKRQVRELLSGPRGVRVLENIEAFLTMGYVMSKVNVEFTEG